MSHVYKRQVDKYPHRHNTVDFSRFCTVFPNISVLEDDWYMFITQHKGQTLHISNLPNKPPGWMIKLNRQTYDKTKRSLPTFDECMKKTPQEACINKYKGYFATINNPPGTLHKPKFQVNDEVIGTIVLNCDKYAYVLLSEIPVKIGKTGHIKTIKQILREWK